MVSTVIVLSRDISYAQIMSTGVQGQVDHRLWREVFPTATWLGSQHRNETGKQASLHEIESRADRYAMQWQDVVAVVMDKGLWNLYKQEGNMYMPAILGFHKRFPDCQVWVVQANGSVVRRTRY